MQYTILCSDLDGTLLTTKNDVSAYTIAEISRIKKHLKVILVSARMPQSMTYLQKRLGIENQPIICYNGALVIDGTKQISSTTIPINIVSSVYELAEATKIKLGLYAYKEWYVEETSERVEKEIKYTKTTPVFRSTATTIADWKKRTISAHKIMLMGTKSTADTLYTELQKHHSTALNIYRSNDTLIEVAPKSVSKLSAIKQLLSPHESLKDIIAFGDNYNDIEMLQHVAMGVAVGNARDEVKAIANAVTLNNTEDGVAHFIKQHLI